MSAPPVGTWSEVWIGQDHGREMHIAPVDDLVEHQLTADCVCGPDCSSLRSGDFLVAHHALDKRP